MIANPVARWRIDKFKLLFVLFVLQCAIALSIDFTIDCWGCIVKIGTDNFSTVSPHQLVEPKVESKLNFIYAPNIQTVVALIP